MLLLLRTGTALNMILCAVGFFGANFETSQAVLIWITRDHLSNADRFNNSSLTETNNQSSFDDDSHSAVFNVVFVLGLLVRLQVASVAMGKVACVFCSVFKEA